MTRSPLLRLKRLIRLVALILLVSGAAFALVVVINRAALFRTETEEYPISTGPLPGTDAQGLPLTSYAAVDPALIPALEALAAHEAPDSLAISAAGIPPIGVYLPGTGDTQLTLPKPTATPTLNPLRTLTPLPTPDDAPPGLGIITPGPGTTIAPEALVAPPPVGYSENPCAPSGWPAPGILTQYFWRWHRAIDIGVPLNTGVVATHSGEVIFAGWRTDGYGNLIIIQNGPFITYYAHLNDFAVIQGQWVTRQQVIGWSGSTGNSTGPHIHYEIRINDVEVDPLTFEDRGHPSC